jgi:hypothetical protein
MVEPIVTSTTAPLTYGSTVSYGQLMGLAIAAGFPLAVAPVMAAIAEAESSGNPNATHTNSNGSVDSGLWQINTANSDVIAQYGNVFDPASNAKMAYAIYKQQGLTAWTTYTSGAYKSHLNTSATAIPLTGTGAGSSPTVAPPYSAATAALYGYTGAANDVAWKHWWDVFGHGVQTPAQGGTTPQQAIAPQDDSVFGGTELLIKDTTQLIEDLVSPVFWRRVGLFVVGAAILIFGVYLWDRRPIDAAVGAVTKVAAVAAA